MDDLERLEERLTELYPADNERQISRNVPAAADTVKQEVKETNDEQEDDFDEARRSDIQSRFIFCLC